MKLRATKTFFYTDLTEEDLKGQLLNDIESPVFPQVISNNECSAAVNSEDESNDSPLSFLIKFKASNVSPSLIPNGVSGVHLPEKGFSNKQVNDNQSHFTSINENHHDLTLKDEAELNALIGEIRKIDPHYQSFDLNDVKKYIIGTLADPEWISFYGKDKKWNKFKNKSLEDSFRNKHCAITREDIAEYLKGAHDGLEQDLDFLKKHNAITDTNKLKVLAYFFPKIYA
ncbi:hypothetical protein [Bdellovibrio sp.]|uniref:hypothetical protein n=1 Tax=Bdellovibrio sp. TaxID=28201 RepID=UPI0039E712BE